ncbi:uncharacterized protein BDFB_007715, partial [Asbolus verrucosus]
MADKAEKVGRPMKFPYTFSAKIAQFPLKYYIKNQWIWRYYGLALTRLKMLQNGLKSAGRKLLNITTK